MKKASLSFSSGRAALLVYGLVLVLLAADQLTKWWTVQYLPFAVPQPAIEPWLYFTHVHNDGAAFSFMRGQRWPLSLIALGVATWIIVYERRLTQRHPLQLTGLACILSGALGNVIDRIRLGYVIDFLDLHSGGRNIWPIFNVADICINLGVGLLILYFWLYPETSDEQTKDLADTARAAKAEKPDEETLTQT